MVGECPRAPGGVGQVRIGYVQMMLAISALFCLSLSSTFGGVPSEWDAATVASWFDSLRVKLGQSVYKYKVFQFLVHSFPSCCGALSNTFDVVFSTH